MRISSLILASHNAGKLREITALLEPLGIQVTSAGSVGLPEPEETGDTFEANAELKAVAAATASGLIALSDDSGLVVPALDGAPGIYSARWAGEGKNFIVAMQRVHEALAARDIDTNGCAAYFVCVLSLAEPTGLTHSVRGEIHGTLTYPPRGKNGFGYDAMFIANGFAETFGEMDPAAKHAISHRAVAFVKLLELLAPDKLRP
jgi:XTP/dITP diphosphohydrolase